MSGLGDVARQMDARVGRLEALASARACPPDAARLADLLASVQSLERAVGRAEASLAAERQALEAARRLEQRLLRQHDTLQFLEASRPSPPEPEPQPQPQRQSAKAPEPRRAPAGSKEKRARRGRPAAAHAPSPQPQQQQQQPARWRAASQTAAVSPAPSQQQQQRKQRGAAGPQPMAPLEFGELDGVPGYMKGRLTEARLGSAMGEIEAIVEAKYRLVSRPLSRVPDKSRAKYKAWKAQECDETRGQFFFSDSDLVGTKHIKQDATGKAILNVLRHLGRVRHVRGAARRYIVIPGAQ